MATEGATDGVGGIGDRTWARRVCCDLVRVRGGASSRVAGDDVPK